MAGSQLRYIRKRMHRIMRICFAVWFILAPVLGVCSAQDLFSAEQKIAQQHAHLAAAENDADRIAADEQLQSLIELFLDLDGSFSHPCDSLRYMYTGTAPDKRFRLFNWNVPLDSQEHLYRCYILSTDKEKGNSWVKLTEAEKSPKKPEFAVLDSDEWMGALYYEIIPVKRGKQTLYTLLGWDGKDRYTNRKIVEVMSFQGKKIRFGAPIFKMEKTTKKRVIFEYADEVSMSLKFHKKDKRIVFDHLSPRKAGLEGNPAFYGPDFTYDALNLEKGKWSFEEKVEPNSPKGNSKKPYNDPRKK